VAWIKKYGMSFSSSSMPLSEDENGIKRDNLGPFNHHVAATQQLPSTLRVNETSYPGHA